VREPITDVPPDLVRTLLLAALVVAAAWSGLFDAVTDGDWAHVDSRRLAYVVWLSGAAVVVLLWRSRGD